jgi:hypothetical protein
MNPLLRRFAVVTALAAVPVVAFTTPLAPFAALTQERSTTLVTVDFRVLARDGSPVLDLKPEEVVLKVGSRTRDIVALELVKAGGDSLAAAVAAAPAPPFITNAPLVGGRNVILLVDDEAIEPGDERPVRDALGQLVAALTPEDHVGLTTVSAGVVTHPTLRHDRLLKDIAGLKGREGNDVGTSVAVRTGATAGTIAGADATCRAQRVHAALMNQAESAVTSVPTLIVLVSNGLAAPSTFVLSTMATGSGQTGACTFTSGDLDALTTAVGKSRVHVYGLEVFRGADVAGGFENFANLTGNARVRLSGDTSGPMKRIASETSAYYVAAFEVTAAERTGSTERVTVTVSREGVDVKAPPTVVIAKPAAAPGTKGAKSDKPRLRDMLASGKAYRDLPLRARVYTSRASQDGKLSAVCVFDSSDPSATFAEASIILFDTTGKARAQWTGQPAAFKGGPVVAMFAAPGPGTYRMRLAVIDTSGAAGAISEDVRVEASNAGTPAASALALGTPARGVFSPRLQFVDEEVAMAAVEVYGLTKAANVTASFEFAASEDGPAVATLPGTIQAPRDDMRMAFVSIPLEQMPAGDVVVRAVIAVDGQPLAARPVHTLRKVVR